MIKKFVSFFILLLLFFMGIELPKTGRENAVDPIHSVLQEELCHDNACITLPDHSSEILYNYQISTFDLPAIPRIEINTLASGAFTTVLLNRLLMKHKQVCQSSPKNPYSLRLLRGEVHPAAARVYYVYTLRRLII
ncbi:MAG: hypothetical protein ACRCSQ_05695 [Bacteroidales bacterium]